MDFRQGQDLRTIYPWAVKLIMYSDKGLKNRRADRAPDTVADAQASG